MGVADSSYFKTLSLSGSATLGTFRLRIFGGYRLSELLTLRCISGSATLGTFRLRIFRGYGHGIAVFNMKGLEIVLFHTNRSGIVVFYIKGPETVRF